MDELENFENRLNGFFKAYDGDDIDHLISFFNKELAIIGTARDEIARDIEEIKQLFERLDQNWRYKSFERRIVKSETLVFKVVGNFAFYVDIRHIEAQSPEGKTILLDPQRLTHIWEKVDGKWKIFHIHASRPEFGLEPGKEYPTKEGVRKDLQSWIDQFNLVLPKGPQKEQMTEYLTKALEVASSSEWHR
jgi:ketosteroid isomerase-like protein